MWYGVRCHGASWCYDKPFKGEDERAFSVLCLCASFGAELVGGESVIESRVSVCRESGYERTFKEFGQGVIKSHSNSKYEAGSVLSLSWPL